jgi:Zn-dependent protease
MSTTFILLLIRVPAILLALTVHELAHGWVAKKMGDRTAENAGRLTLNPMAHLDIFGTLMLFFGPFGWAKPVPVNPMNFPNPKRDMALVAAAGPASNIALAAITGMLFRLDLVTPYPALAAFCYILFMINIGLAVFNLLPVYPLDGSRILVAFLRQDQMAGYQKAMQVIPKIFLGMIVAEWLFKIPVLSYVLSPIFNPVFGLAKALFLN